MQDTGSLFYCMWGVFYSSESEKKKKKKKSVNAAFPPTLLHPPGLRRKKSEEQKKRGEGEDQLNISILVIAVSFVAPFALFIKRNSPWRILNTGYIRNLNSYFQLDNQTFGSCNMDTKIPYFEPRWQRLPDRANMPQGSVGLEEIGFIKSQPFPYQKQCFSLLEFLHTHLPLRSFPKKI